MNCFLLYCQDYRSYMFQTHPGLSNSEVTSLLSEEWTQLKPAAKQKYREKYEKLKQVRVYAAWLYEPNKCRSLKKNIRTIHRNRNQELSS